MGNYYHFVVLPCDPVSPTQKALVEDAVRISYSRIHAKLRNRTFYSLLELNQAVWELMEKHNQTRMQKRPYSHEYVKLIFDPQRTNQPEEIYYKLCDSIISLKRKYELDVFNLTCRQCIEYKVFSYRQFEAILKRNQLYAASEESVNMTAPTPTSHGNMRGKGYFAKTSV